MSNIYIEYLYGCFNENDIEEIKQINNAYNFNLELQEKQPTIVNAALDELVGEILLYINSNELQTAIAIFNIAEFLASVVKWMWNKLKKIKLSKVTSKTAEEKQANIIIQVDNVKILLDKTASEEELSKYLRVALQESKIATQNAENKQIIIDGNNNTVNMYLLEEYAKKTIGEKHKAIRVTAHSNNDRRK